MIQAIQLDSKKIVNRSVSKQQESGSPGNDFAQTLKEIKASLCDQSQQKTVAKKMEAVVDMQQTDDQELLIDPDVMMQSIAMASIQQFTISTEGVKSSDGRMNAINALHCLNSVGGITNLTVSQNPDDVQIIVETRIQPSETIQTVSEGNQLQQNEMLIGQSQIEESGLLTDLSNKTSTVKSKQTHNEKLEMIQGNLLRTEKKVNNDAPMQSDDEPIENMQQMGYSQPLQTGTQVKDAVMGTDPQKERIIDSNVQSQAVHLSTTGTQTVDLAQTVEKSAKDASLPKTQHSVIQQLDNQIIANLKQNNSEFTMQLHPRDLGEINVKMTTKDGILTIELSAENLTTQQMLVTNAEELRVMIQTSQQTTVQLTYPQNDTFEPQQQNQQSETQQQQQQQENEQEEISFETTNNFLTFMQQFHTSLT